MFNSKELVNRYTAPTPPHISHRCRKADGAVGGMAGPSWPTVPWWVCCHRVDQQAREGSVYEKTLVKVVSMRTNLFYSKHLPSFSWVIIRIFASLCMYHSGTYHVYFAFYSISMQYFINFILVMQPTDVVKIVLEIDSEKIAHEKVVNCITDYLIKGVQQVDQYVSDNVNYTHSYAFVLHTMNDGIISFVNYINLKAMNKKLPPIVTQNYY